MRDPQIRNVVFDIGNVLVTWSPETIVRRTFGDGAPIARLTAEIFGSELWRSLNRGELSEREAMLSYRAQLGLDESTVEALFHHTKASLDLIEDTAKLVARLDELGFALFALTDNVHEIVAYLRRRYTFWQHFAGVVSSAEVRVLKPDPAIFWHLLETHRLRADQTVFFDDVERNVEGAARVGIHGRLFVDPAGCERDLRALGVLV